ncbi:LapA family protein [Salisaeta longa]|uniref:LapA family protein n=1 Tax=Salisaeta longa TaxID=503170 RepID=UPI000419A6B1|nr:LapA family protein [Salisaeta longa]
MRLTLISSLLLAVLAVVFALQNTATITVNLLFYETRGSAALVIILSFAVGVLVGLLATIPRRMRDRREIKQLKRDLRDAHTPADPKAKKDKGAGSTPSVPPTTP